MRKGLQNSVSNENTNYKIIAVDDEEGILDSLSIFLKRSGYNFTGVTNPEEAVEKEDNNSNNYINELKKIRVNNCFTDAKKESLISNQAIWNQKKSDTNVDKRILGLIVDSQLVASSLNNAIVTTKLASMATLINNQLEDIENSLNLKFHFL